MINILSVVYHHLQDDWRLNWRPETGFFRGENQVKTVDQRGGETCQLHTHTVTHTNTHTHTHTLTQVNTDAHTCTDEQLHTQIHKIPQSHTLTQMDLFASVDTHTQTHTHQTPAGCTHIPTSHINTHILVHTCTHKACCNENIIIHQPCLMLLTVGIYSVVHR